MSHSHIYINKILYIKGELLMNFLFLVGPDAVGKSCFLNELSTKTNFFTFDIKKQLKKLHQEYSPKIKFEKWINYLNRKHGSYGIYEMLQKEFDKEYDGSNNVVITRFSEIQGIEYMIMYYKPELYEILYLDADYNLLKSNLESKEKINISDKKFQKHLVNEEENGLKYIKDLATSNLINFRYFKKNNNEDDIPIYIFENLQRTLNKK